LQLGLPVCTPENYYNTLVELTKASDFASPDRFWTDPQKMPPRPAPPPPPQIIVEQIKSASQEKQKAADILQREVESQRKAQLEKYAIDANAGSAIIAKHVDHSNTIAIETMKASHTASIDALNAKLDKTVSGTAATQKAVADAHNGIAQHGLSAGATNDALDQVIATIKHHAAIASGKKVLRHNGKGELEGLDIVDHAGKVLASHKAIRNSHGHLELQ